MEFGNFVYLHILREVVYFILVYILILGSLKYADTLKYSILTITAVTYHLICEWRH